MYIQNNAKGCKTIQWTVTDNKKYNKDYDFTDNKRDTSGILKQLNKNIINFIWELMIYHFW